jgi:hypothetical protein
MAELLTQEDFDGDAEKRGFHKKTECWGLCNSED